MYSLYIFTEDVVHNLWKCCNKKKLDKKSLHSNPENIQILVTYAKFHHAEVEASQQSRDSFYCTNKF